MAESTVVAALVLRLVRQFGALADLGREDQQVAIYDQLRLLISSVVLSDISVVKQVISLASPVAIILANSKAQPSEGSPSLPKIDRRIYFLIILIFTLNFLKPLSG